MRPFAKKKRRRLRWVIVAYLALLVVSHLVRLFRPAEVVTGGENKMEVQAVKGERLLNQPVSIAYLTFNSEAGDSRPVIVMLHGSPGEADDFRSLGPRLAANYRLIAPDLPGFGYSTSHIPDYSFRAHARYLLEMLDKLKVERAHLIAFSMGGGVALSLADIAPERVASITMLSAIGVQEMEMFGDYHLNHAIHGIQLAGFWWLQEGVPHFGYLPTTMAMSYARNFYDSDQRPLRAILARYGGPMQIIHGRHDPLVPVEAAVEHHRLVPQSELKLTDESHFMVFARGQMLSPLISDFVNRAEQGTAQTRATADPARVAEAAQPFNTANLPKIIGVTAFVLLLMIIAATLVSEDLTTISVGVMVAQGRVGFLFGTIACFLGIFIGDIMLFLAGRWLGRPALARAPLKWLLRPEAVERSSAWFSRKGVVVIAASRFLPGARLPTYFAAGLLNTSFWWFTFYFALACAVWTPLLVGLSAVLGAEAVKSAFFGGQHFLLKVLVIGFLLMVVVRLLLRLATWRGRRMLVSSWRRLVRWEFWPLWAFYPPIICYIVWLALKHRSLTLFTASNPAIPAGGFVGESKMEILRGLAGADGFIARAELIPASPSAAERVAQAKKFMTEHQLGFPVVLKPDAGQRGAGVQVVRSERELEGFFRGFGEDAIIQEYAPGNEFGVFYYRYPDETRGRVFSITEKRFPVVTGDGTSTLEQLILNDERAVCMSRFYCEKQKDRLWDVPEQGEKIQLVELGTHCRGAIFLDGGYLKTDALEAAIDRVSRGFDGFHFGRYDIRVPSVEAFREGRDFKVIELNGVTSEATHIYDPKNSLFTGYRVLFEQWRIAFEIGAQNRRRGAKPATLRELVRMMIEFRERSDSSARQPRPGLQTG
ncbi:MAG TPA: alpha/beta fold hydrolase [Blastocatellia bacterium]|nr:alpha/beta fold hydrolase [Blastocatellia bacterium]